MPIDRSTKAKELFEEALECPVRERASYLAKACAGDEDLLAEVQSLLEHVEDGDGGILAKLPQADSALAEIRDAFRQRAVGTFVIGEKVGPYVVRDRIGEGGMSYVYRASQSEPVKREVAIKALKPGMDSGSVLARFETERQVLGAMEHPGIAQVFDAGISESGHSYFVMELVRGSPINEFCDARRLDIQERIEVFLSVCRAVQHAHMRGVIHRDLKPTNILVAEHEGLAVPKVIDFGVSKAVHLSGDDRHTLYGQPVGTPAYMSPEQWGAELDLDVRADVYSLGVVLYQLLTGRYPYQFDTVKGGRLDLVRAAVEASDPARPSSRVEEPDSVESSPIGGSRSSALAKELRGDLDWILLKALAKERTRRYPSVEAFVEDLCRYLAREPISARPPSAVYRCRLFCRRHQVLSIACAFLVIGLAAALGGIGYHVARINEELDRTSQALDRAKSAEAEAMSRADQLERVAAFQSRQLAAVDVEQMGERIRQAVRAGVSEDADDGSQIALGSVNFTNIALDALDHQVLAPSLETIELEFKDQPLIQARLLQAISITFRELGLLEEASEPLERAVAIRESVLGAEHPDTIATNNLRVALLLAQGRDSEAGPIARSAIATCRRVLGDEHPDTLTSIAHVGFVLQRQGLLDEAEPYYRQALDARRRVLGVDHPDTIMSANNLGLLLKSLGRLDEAEPYYREAVESSRRVLGRDSRETLMAVSNLGLLLYSQQKLVEAEPYYREALESFRRVAGDRHPNTLSAINNMGFLLQSQGRLVEAEQHYREALEGRREVLGEDHPRTLTSMNNLGFLLQTRGMLEEAERTFRETLHGRRRALGIEHPATLASFDNLAFVQWKLGRLAEAENNYREAFRSRERIHGLEHRLTLVSARGLAAVLNSRKRYAEAEVIAREALAVGERVLGPENWQVAEARSILGESLAGLGQYQEAEPLLLSSYQELDEATGIHPSLRPVLLQTAARRVADLYDAMGRDSDAEVWRARAGDGASAP